MNKFQAIGVATSLVFASNFVAAGEYELADLSVGESGSINWLIDVDDTAIFFDEGDTFRFTVPDDRTATLDIDITFDWAEIMSIAIIDTANAEDIFRENVFSSYNLNVEGLESGDYDLFLNGYIGGDSYSLTGRWSLNTVSPVPEPSSIALMLGGLGFVGFMAARRRKHI